MHNNNNHNHTASTVDPLIPADQSLPEITVKAVILSILLVILLAASNAYLGLKIGNTISASIPAAVISMGILRLFRKSNVLENNIVQTAASAGEAIVAGIAFILPALLIIHYWQDFNYYETMLIALIGGIFGVLFSVPLRRVLLNHKVLRFPEGTAIGQVLKASVAGTTSLKYLLQGGAVGGFISLCQTGFEMISDEFNLWITSSSGYIYGFGVGFNPALLAAGYIVGINIGISVLIGIIIGWIAGIPLTTHFYGAPTGDALSSALSIWHSHIRYLGVGTMLVGGFWTLLTLLKPIYDGLRSSFASLRAMKIDGNHTIRTERDMPINYIAWVALVLLIPLGFLLHHFACDPILQLSTSLKAATVILGILFVVLIGFIFSALGGYFAGLVGSTNSPGSALSLSAVLLMSLLILALLGHHLHLIPNATQTISAAALAIIISSILGAANVITNETIQDLKAGQMVGATPWKQQVMLIIGVAVASLFLPLILQLLFNAYGIGGVFPHPGMNPSQMLAAPQAGLMAALAQGVFSHNLPLNMIEIGAVIAVIGIIIDSQLRKRGNASLPVLAVGFGIYLPLSASAPFAIGAIASYFIDRGQRRKVLRTATAETNTQSLLLYGRQRVLILACGIVAGASLMGVILAIPFAIAQSSDVLKIVSDNFTPIANILGALSVIGLLGWMYRVAVKQPKN